MVLLCALALAGETGAIEGRLLRADGSPWAEAQISAYKLGEKKIWRQDTETDQEGRFRLTDLPPGRYVIRHGPRPEPGGGGPFDDLVTEMFEGLTLISLAQDAADAITVEAGKTAHKMIRLPKQGSVRFKLTHGGKPVSGAEVKVFRVDAEDKPSFTLSLSRKHTPRTDRQGVVSLGEIDEGRYAVEVRIGDWSVYGGVHRVDSGTPRTVPVALGEHVVRVKVLDGAGKPVRTASVTVSWGEKDWDFVRSRDMENTRSKDGVYAVPYCRAGLIRVWVNGPGDSTGGVREIEVVDAKGQSVPGVHVNISNADSARGIPSFGYDVDRRGELRWEGTLRRWRVRIDDFDFVPSEGVIVKPEAGDERIVRLTLPERK